MSGILHQLLIAPGIGASGGLIVKDMADVNLRNLLLANGWNGITVVTATFTIAPSATIYSSSTATPALTTGAPFPTGSTLTLINNGKIYGHGGSGAIGGSNVVGYYQSGADGYAGGPALEALYAISIHNSGQILGGGGGGGTSYGGAGGGGGGMVNGIGGAAAVGSGQLNGGNATLTAYGLGGYKSGNGGIPGQPGGNSINPGYVTINQTQYYAGYGGAAGTAYLGLGFITFI